MAKFTYKEIKNIIDSTPAELKGQDLIRRAHLDIGSFWKRGANWGYMVKALVHNGQPILVVAVSGIIE